MIGDYARSARYLEFCVRRRPRNPRLHVSLAGLYCKLGQPDRALEQIERALALEPSDGVAYHTLLVARDALKQTDRSRIDLRSFEDLLRSRRDRDGWALIFDVYRSIGFPVLDRSQQLGDDLDRLRAAAAEDVDARMILAYSLQAMHRFEDAIAEFDRVLERAPDHLRALYGRAILLRNRARNVGAPGDRAQDTAAVRHPLEGVLYHRRIGQLVVEDRQAI